MSVPTPPPPRPYRGLRPVPGSRSRLRCRRRCRPGRALPRGRLERGPGEVRSRQEPARPRPRPPPAARPAPRHRASPPRDPREAARCPRGDPRWERSARPARAAAVGTGPAHSSERDAAKAGGRAAGRACRHRSCGPSSPEVPESALGMDGPKGHPCPPPPGRLLSPSSRPRRSHFRLSAPRIFSFARGRGGCSCG